MSFWQRRNIHYSLILSVLLYLSALGISIWQFRQSQSFTPTTYLMIAVLALPLPFGIYYFIKYRRKWAHAQHRKQARSSFLEEYGLWWEVFVKNHPDGYTQVHIDGPLCPMCSAKLKKRKSVRFRCHRCSHISMLESELRDFSLEDIMFFIQRDHLLYIQEQADKFHGI